MCGGGVRIVCVGGCGMRDCVWGVGLECGGEIGVSVWGGIGWVWLLWECVGVDGVGQG